MRTESQGATSAGPGSRAIGGVPDRDEDENAGAAGSAGCAIGVDGE